MKKPNRWPCVDVCMRDNGNLVVRVILEVPHDDCVADRDYQIFSTSHTFMKFEDCPNYEHLARTIGSMFETVARDIGREK